MIILDLYFLTMFAWVLLIGVCLQSVAAAVLRILGKERSSVAYFEKAFTSSFILSICLSVLLFIRTSPPDAFPIWLAFSNVAASLILWLVCIKVFRKADESVSKFTSRSFSELFMDRGMLITLFAILI